MTPNWILLSISIINSKIQNPMQGKNWLITLNNPKVPLEDYMDMWKDRCNYCNG